MGNLGMRPERLAAGSAPFALHGRLSAEEPSAERAQQCAPLTTSRPTGCAQQPGSDQWVSFDEQGWVSSDERQELFAILLLLV
jgi:hypothetical protein